MKSSITQRPEKNFDRQLFSLHFSELAEQMQAKSIASDRRARAQPQKAGSILLNIVNGQLALLNEWLERVDQICREIRQIQGGAVTPDFVHQILVPEAMLLIEARHSTIKGMVSLAARRSRIDNIAPHLRSLSMRLPKLKSEVKRRYEKEARTLAHKIMTDEREAARAQTRRETFVPRSEKPKVRRKRDEQRENYKLAKAVHDLVPKCIEGLRIRRATQAHWPGNRARCENALRQAGFTLREDIDALMESKTAAGAAERIVAHRKALTFRAVRNAYSACKESLS